MDENRRVEEDGRLIIYKDEKSKFYQMRARPDGVRRYIYKSLRTTDYVKAVSIARKEYRQLEENHEKGLSLYKKDMNILLDEFRKYVEDCVTKDIISTHMARNHINFTKGPIGEFFKDKSLQALSPDVLNEYQVWRTNHAGRKLAKPSMRFELTTIRAVMQYAASQKLLSFGSIPQMKLKKGLSRASKVRPHFTGDEMVLMREKMGKWIKEARDEDEKYSRRMMHYYVQIMSMTGMRTNDTIDLQWKHITFFHKTVGNMKRRYANFIVSGKPTEDRPTRELTGQPHCVEQIDHWFQRCKWTDPDDLVFCEKRGVPWKPSIPFKKMLIEFDMLCDSMGNVRVPYSLRHTYATLRLEAGIPIQLLAKQMGTSVKNIEDIYGHINLKDQVDKLARLKYTTFGEDFPELY